MTLDPISSSGTNSAAPSPNILAGLVRLLAREAAKAEFATRCKSGGERVGHD
ncbi:hypothetical protein [Seohaeicola zhoushanensis]|uniref:Uncharacterized protein n=1 Tax=Seohaeicola zhoushanensis TaxID=1569283 RepID=A0A8J3MCL6_9RHOB|nr:hypothetical protein [Seohaeicola zhoushanensis]GHF76011.1 hypothetical protein GCM10017056_52950 [Seohaeicola zhoushanensis]